MKKNQWVKPATYGLIVLIVPMLVYYLFYVQSREDTLLSRNYAHLTNIASGTSTRINSIFTVAANACKNPNNFSKDIEKNDLGLSVMTPTGSLNPAAGCETLRNRSINAFQSNAVTQERLEISIGKRIPSLIAESGEVNASDANGESNETTSKVSAPQGWSEITLSVDTNKLVGDIDSFARFYDVYIFDGYGNVVFQKYPLNGRIDHYSDLVSARLNNADESSILSDPLSSVRTQYRGRNFLLLSQPILIDFSNYSQSGSWNMVALLEEGNFNKEKLQFQPDTAAWIVLIVVILLLIAPFLKLWHLGRLESFTLVDVFLLLVSGCVLTAVVTLLAFQIQARSGMEQFLEERRLSDISTSLGEDLSLELYQALFELTIAEEIMIGALNTSLLAKARENSEDAERISLEVEEQAVAAGIAEIVTESEITRDIVRLALGVPDTDVLDFCGGNYEGIESQDRANLLGESSDYNPEVYPYFKQLYLMDGTGCQIVKWSTQDNPTNRNRYADREYFVNSLPQERVGNELYELEPIREESEKLRAMRERLQMLGHTAEEIDEDIKNLRGSKFFLEFITSRSTGEKSLAISKPVSEKLGERGSELSPLEHCLANPEISPCVSVMTTSNLRTFENKLPIGFGFAVLDSEGQILFHHEGDANTEYYLHDELGDESLLRAALYANNDSSFSTDYHGEDHRFIVSPVALSGSGLFLVTFYSQYSAFMPLFESAGVALVSWLVWFAVLFFFVLTLWQLNRFSSGRILRGIRQWYGHGNLFASSAILLSVALSYFYPIVSLIAPLALLPLLFFWFINVFEKYHFRPMLVFISVLIVLVASSLPMSGFVRLIQTEAIAAFIQLHVHDFNTKADDQRLIVKDWIASRDMDDSIVIQTDDYPLQTETTISELGDDIQLPEMGEIFDQSDFMGLLLKGNIKEISYYDHSDSIRNATANNDTRTVIATLISDNKMRFDLPLNAEGRWGNEGRFWPQALFDSNTFVANGYANAWANYPLFQIDKQFGAIEQLADRASANRYLIEDESLEATSLWQRLLSEIPEYSEDTIALHAMYQNPKTVRFSDDVDGESFDLRDLSSVFQASEIYNIFGVEFWVILALVGLLILGAAMWYVLVRTIGLRSESYPRVSKWTSPYENCYAKELIYYTGNSSGHDFFNVNNFPSSTWIDLLQMSVDTANTLIDSKLPRKVSSSISSVGIKEAEIATAVQTTNTESEPKSLIIVDHFDSGLDDRAIIEQRIAMLEKLAYTNDVAVIILMTVDMLSFVTSTFHVADDAPLIARLASLLSLFHVSYYEEHSMNDLPTTKPDLALRNECDHPMLRQVYLSIQSQININGLDDHEIVQAVKMRANAIYQYMWSMCTHEDKIMLIELAQGNLVNPNNWHIARQLRNRGYLKRDPFHRIFNESFRQFVRQMERLEDVDSWRREGTSSWNTIRAPLFVLVISAVIFLGATQPAVFNSIFAFAAAGAASLPFLVNLILARVKSNSAK